MSDQTFIAGIDPATRKCTFVSVDDDRAREECRKDRLIIVPVSRDTARECWGETIADVYAIADGARG